MCALSERDYVFSSLNNIHLMLMMPNDVMLHEAAGGFRLQPSCIRLACFNKHQPPPPNTLIYCKIHQHKTLVCVI